MARGGNGQGVLGWHRKAISAYTWCVTEKGPQNKWLHKIKKADTPNCRCQQEHPTQEQEQSGEHLVERCSLLTRARTQVGKKELLEWKSRHARNKVKKKEKGPVGPAELKTEKEEDKLETFFCKVYEFHNPIPVAPAFIPAELPPRYAISFVPAAPPVVSSTRDRSVISSANFVVSPTTDYSVISSVNFVVPSSSTSPSTCIETT